MAGANRPIDYKRNRSTCPPPVFPALCSTRPLNRAGPPHC